MSTNHHSAARSRKAFGERCIRFALVTLLVIAARAEATELIRSGTWVGEVIIKDGKFVACELKSSEPSTIFDVLTITGNDNQNISLSFPLINDPKKPVTVPAPDILNVKLPAIEEVKLDVSLRTGGEERAFGVGTKEIFERTYAGTAFNNYSPDYLNIGSLPHVWVKSSRISFTLDKDDPLLTNFGAADWLVIRVLEPFNGFFRLRFTQAITLPRRPRATDASRALATIKSCVAAHTNTNTTSHH